MSSEHIELIETKLLKPFKYPRLVHNGYLYHFHKSCSHHLRWKCNRVYSMKCPAVIRTNSDLQSIQFIAADHEHVHGDDRVAIYELKMKIKTHQKSSLFTNNTMFKPKNGYTELNFDEEDKPENIDNKLARFCASMNQVSFVNPLDPDYEDRYIDKREQAIKIKKSNDKSSNFENDSNNTFLQRNRRKQKQIEINNAKNDITENNISSSSFDDKINISIQTCGEIMPNELNMIASKKKKNDRQMNESSLLTSTHKEENNLNINTCQEKNSSISNINKKNTLTTNMNKEKNILTTNTHKILNNLTINTRRAKNSVVSDMNIDKNTLTSNMPEEKNTMATNTNKKINNLINNTRQVNISVINNINIDRNTLTCNMHEEKNTLNTNTNQKIKNLTINSPQAKNSVNNNMNIDKNTLTSNMPEEKNTMTTNTNIKINNLTNNTCQDKNSVINNINIDGNTLTRNTHKEINNFSIKTHKKKNSLISYLNKPKNALAIIMHKSKNTLPSNKLKEVNTLTTNSYKKKNSLISNKNNQKNVFTSNIYKKKYFLARKNYKVKNTLTTNTHKHKRILSKNKLKNINIRTTNKQNKKSRIITNTRSKIISLKLKKYKFKPTNQKKPQKSTPTVITSIIKSTPTILTPTVKSTLTVESTPIILTPEIKSMPTILTPEIISTPTVITSIIKSTPTVKSTLTVESTPIILTPEIKSMPTILTPEIISTPTILTPEIIKTPTILIPKIISTPTVITSIIKSTPTAKSTLTVESTPIILTPKIKSMPTILTPEIISTPPILTPKIINTPTILIPKIIRTPSVITSIIKSTPTVITSIIKSTPTILTPTVKSTLTVKSTPTILTSTVKSTPTIVKSTPMVVKSTPMVVKSTPTIVKNIPTLKITPSIKSCMNKGIDYENDVISINSDNDSDDVDDIDHHDEEDNNITKDVNLVNDNIIPMYCKEYWPTVLNKMRDPLTGAKVFESILFNKICTLMQHENSNSKLNIENIKSSTTNWKLKCDCLAFKMETLKEHIRTDKNTRHIDIQNKNKKDTQLCKNVTKENNKDINKKDLKNNITPENFKTSKLYQQSLNSQNRNLTRSDTDIKTAKFKEIKKNTSLTPVMVDMIKKIPSSTIVSISSPELLKSEKRNLTKSDTCITRTDLIKKIPPSTIVSITSPESFKSKKRNLTESDTCITRTKSKIKKTKNSSISNVNLDVHIPLETSVSIISPKSFDIKQHNLTQSDSVIKMTRSKNMKLNEPYTPVLNIPKASRVSQRLINSRKCKLIQSNTAIEMTEPKVTEYNNHSTLVSTNVCANTPSHMPLLRSRSKLFNSKKTISTQSDIDIGITKSNIIKHYEHFTPGPIDITPDMTASMLSSNFLKSQQSILGKYNTDIEITESNKIEYYEPSTSTSIDLTVNNAPVIKSSGLNYNLLNNQRTISTRYNTAIKKTKSKKTESTPAYIDLTVDSPPDMTASRISPTMLNSQQSILTQNDPNIKISESNIIEYYDPYTQASVVLNLNNQSTITNASLSRKKNNFSQYNKDIKISSTSMSTDLSSNIPTFSSSSRSAITPLDVEDNAELSTINLSKNPNFENWKCPTILTVFPKTAKGIAPVIEQAILPIAIRRGIKPNMCSPAQYPMLNKLLTQSTSTTIKNNITPVNIQRKAPLPDVVDESTQIMNKVNYTETIQSNHSHNNLNKAPYLMKPVPIAIPLLPSEIIYDCLDEIGVKRPFCHGNLTKYNENILLPRPILSIKPNNGTIRPSITLSWVLNTKFQAETIWAYEVYCCEPISGGLNDGFNPWTCIGETYASAMACTVTKIDLRGKKCYYSIRAKNVNNENGPFSHPRPFTLI